ncbi:MAG: transglycosylase SLT domain-containing protein [Myxococcales bacterium]
MSALIFTVAPAARAGDAAGEAGHGTGSRSKAGSGKGSAARAPVGAACDTTLSQRRAVRGIPVEEGVESPELNELRRFEEQAFARPGSNPAPASTADSDAIMEAPPTLPGRWEGTGDVPEAVRAPETTLTLPRPLPAPDSDWLRSLKLPELPVRWDPQVLRYLDYFKNDVRGRSVMSNWIRRAGRFRTLFEGVLAREGLPKDLLYVAMVESGFETGARSSVGAGGVWQFMPGAARAYGLEVGYWVDARRDPEKSVEAAARYLKDLYVRFGSWHLVFAAYNAGYGAVLKSITRYNTNDYWELCHHESGLPWESSLYVPKILAAAIVGHNLQAFGFGDIVADPPFAYDRVQVPPGTGLVTVARATSTRQEVIAALNPQMIRERTPPDRGKYEVRVPAGSAPLFAESFDRVRAASDRFETVTLRFGETLDDVARARRITARELRRLNGVKDTTELRAGITILVPPKSTKGGVKAPPTSPGTTGDGGAVAAGRGAQGDSVDSDEGGGTGGGGTDEDEILVAVPERVFNYEGRERVFYRTRDGDTLDDIAEALGVRPDDLVDWNNLDGSAKLHPKMVLQVFVRKDFDPTQIVLLDSAHVRVVTLGSQEFLELDAARRGKKRLVIEAKAGETLARIGRRYGLTVGDLARINRFSYNTELQAGQKVVVYSPVGANARELAQGLAPEPRHERAVAALTRTIGMSRTPGKPLGKQPGGQSRAVDSKQIARRATGDAKLEEDNEGGKNEGGKNEARQKPEPPKKSPEKSQGLEKNERPPANGGAGVRAVAKPAAAKSKERDDARSAMPSSVGKPAPSPRGAPKKK